MERNYYVYILAKARNSTLYTGVTNDLIRRIYEHKTGVADGFTKKYRIKLLVYYEPHTDIEAAIRREKLIKRWKREYKRSVIEAMNPMWGDLYPGLIGGSAGEADPAIRRGDMQGEYAHG